MNDAPFRLSLGKRGEMIGWNYLRKHGFEILDKNYRCKIGEIDVVARKRGKIIFIEIKTRRLLGFGRPEESVHPVKQKKLIRLAAWYLKEKKWDEAACSFHVLAILLKDNEEPEIQLIEDAFTADAVL